MENKLDTVQGAIDTLTNVNVSGLDYDTMQNLINQYRKIIDDKVAQITNLKNENLALQSEKINLEESLRMANMQIEALQRVTVAQVEEKEAIIHADTIADSEISLEDLV